MNETLDAAANAPNHSARESIELCFWFNHLRMALLALAVDLLAVHLRSIGQRRRRLPSLGKRGLDAEGSAAD